MDDPGLHLLSERKGAPGHQSDPYIRRSRDHRYSSTSGTSRSATALDPLSNAMGTSLTTDELALLTAANRHRYLDPAGGPATGSHAVGLTTDAACRAEDRRRANALRNLTSKPWIVDCNPNGLANLLDAIADSDLIRPIQPCLASASYMRQRRIDILGAILELAIAHPEIPLAWITTRDPTLGFHPSHTWIGILGEARRRLFRQMKICGALAAPGFLMAYLTGYLQPRSGRYQLAFRGIAGGEKLNLLCDWEAFSRSASPPRIDRINVHPIMDLGRQIGGVMPNLLPELTLFRDGSVSGTKRMSEPAHSVYLTWLARYDVGDMWITNGVTQHGGKLIIGPAPRPKPLLTSQRSRH